MPLTVRVLFSSLSLSPSPSPFLLPIPRSSHIPSFQFLYCTFLDMVLRQELIQSQLVLNLVPFSIFLPSALGLQAHATVLKIYNDADVILQEESQEFLKELKKLEVILSFHLATPCPRRFNQMLTV